MAPERKPNKGHGGSADEAVNSAEAEQPADGAAEEPSFDPEPIGRRRKRRRRLRPAPAQLDEEAAADIVEHHRDEAAPRHGDRITPGDSDEARPERTEPGEAEHVGRRPSRELEEPRPDPWNVEEGTLDEASDGEGASADSVEEARSEDVWWSALPDAEPQTMLDAAQTRVEAVDRKAAYDEKTLIFEDPNGSAEAAQPAAARLVVIQGEEAGREVELLLDELTIGRGPDNDLVFSDIACSRRHAILEHQGEEWLISDLGSGNGTLVNGVRRQRQVLQHEDEIEIGKTVLQFLLPQAVGFEEAAEDVRTPIPESRPVTSVGTRPRTAAARFVADLLADPHHRKLFVMGSGIVGGVIGLMLLIRLILPSSRPEATAAEVQRQRQQQIQAQLEQHMSNAKRLVEEKKWQAALREAKLAKQIDPKSQIVDDYLTSIHHEMNAASAIDQARTSIEQKDWETAGAALARVRQDSVYSSSTEELKRAIDEGSTSDLIAQGAKLMEAKQVHQALLKFRQALERNPLHEEARDKKRQCEAEIAKADERQRLAELQRSRRSSHRRDPSRTKGSSARPTGRLLALYRDGEIDRAIETAQNAGSTKQLVLLRRFYKTYETAVELAKNPGQVKRAVKALQAANKLDHKISGGSGKFHQELIHYLAKAYFVTGVDAFAGKRYPECYRSLKKALKYRPDFDKARDKLNDLEKIAKRLYEEAYVIMGNQPEPARQRLEVVLQIIPPDHVYYGKAKKLKGRLHGPSRVDAIEPSGL